MSGPTVEDAERALREAMAAFLTAYADFARLSRPPRDSPTRRAALAAAFRRKERLGRAADEAYAALVEAERRDPS